MPHKYVQMITGSRGKTLGCIILLFILTTLFFAPVVFFDKTFVARDNYIFHNPRRFFAAESIKEGNLPLWNPYIACGVPFQANMQSSVFYPFSTIYYFLPFQKGFKYFIVLHYFLAGLFMFILMREWEASRYAAFFSALVFSFGGYLVSINDNVSFLTAGAWLPLVIACHHRALKSGSFFYCMLTSMVIAIEIFAGDASFCILSTFICGFLYTLFWPVVNNCSQSSSPLRTWILFVLSWVAGLCLAGVQLLPFAEFALHSTRFEGLSFELTTKWSCHPLEMIRLVIPYVFGSTVPATRWFGQLWLDTFYIGIFPLVFVILFISCGKGNMKYFLLTLLFVSVFLCFGKYNPFFKYLHRFMPGANLLMFPVKFIFIASFSLSVMAGKGVPCFLTLLDRRDSAYRVLKYLAFFSFFLTAILAGGYVFKDEAYTYFYRIYPKTEYMLSFNKVMFLSLYKGIAVSIVLLLLFSIVTLTAIRLKTRKAFVLLSVAAIAYLDLGLVGKPRDPIVDESVFTQNNNTIDFLHHDDSLFRIYSLSRAATKGSFMHLYNVPFEKTYQVLQESLLVNLNMYHHIYSIDEYSAILNKAFYEVFLPVDSFFREKKPVSADAGYCSRVFNLLNVKYIISPFALKGFSFSLVKDGPIKIYENPEVLPRVFFVQKLVVLNSEEDVLVRIKSADFDPEGVAYISREEAQKIHEELAEQKNILSKKSLAGYVNVADYKPNRVSLNVRASRSGLLILSDTFYPGWKAFVNGKEVPVVKVNHILKGILVDEGKHDIVFIFRPVAFAIGAIVSLTTFLITGIGLIVLRKNALKA